MYSGTLGKKSAVRPIGDHVVVRRKDAEDSTPGGIVLPDDAKDKPTRGTVLAVGSGTLLRDGTRSGMEVCEGNDVVFHKHGGYEVEIDGETLVVLREQEILLVIT